MQPRKNESSHHVLYGVSVAVSKRVEEGYPPSEAAWVGLDEVYEHTESLWQHRADLSLTVDSFDQQGGEYLAVRSSVDGSYQYGLTNGGREFLSRNGPPNNVDHNPRKKMGEAIGKFSEVPTVPDDQENRSALSTDLVTGAEQRLTSFINFGSLTVHQEPTLGDVGPAGLAVVLKVEDPSRSRTDIVDLLQIEHGVHVEPTAVDAALKRYLSKTDRMQLEKTARKRRGEDSASSQADSPHQAHSPTSENKTTYRELSEVPQQQLIDATTILGVTTKKNEKHALVQALADHGVQARNYGGGATPVINVEGEWVDVRQTSPALQTGETDQSSDSPTQTIVQTLERIIDDADETVDPEAVMSRALEGLARNGESEALRELVAAVEAVRSDADR